jgi:hypothetical protein
MKTIREILDAEPDRALARAVEEAVVFQDDYAVDQPYPTVLVTEATHNQRLAEIIAEAIHWGRSDRGYSYWCVKHLEILRREAL